MFGIRNATRDCIGPISLVQNYDYYSFFSHLLPNITKFDYTCIIHIQQFYHNREIAHLKYVHIGQESSV